MSYQFRELSQKDINSIDSLFSEAFGYKPNKKLIKWKYFQNPCGQAVIVGAFYGDTLVASGAMTPEKINFFGETKIVYKFADLMTHPNHQRKSLSTKINGLLLEHKQIKNSLFTYCLCSKLATKSFLKNNWSYLDSIFYYFKPFLLIKLSSLISPIKLQSIEFFDSVGNTLDNYQFENNHSKISVNKSSEFMKWRTANPNFIYKLICHKNNQREVDGYLIYSISENNVLNVIDVETGGNISVFKKLVRGVESVALKEKHKAIVVFCLLRSSLGKLFKSERFFVNPYQKGPLKSQMDLNFFSQTSTEELLEIDLWDIYALSHDDV